MLGRKQKLFLIFNATVLIIGIIALTFGIVFFLKVRDETIDESKNQIEPMWGYRCEQNRCQKYRLNSENYNSSQGLFHCRLFCDANRMGTVWPLPTGDIEISSNAVNVDPDKIVFITSSFKANEEHWKIAETRFLEMVKKKHQKKYPLKSGGAKLTIEVVADTDAMKFDYATSEGYKLTVDKSNNDFKATIKAANFYGSRHGLETLSQLIIFDEIKSEFLLVEKCAISDAPKFVHRGISLDTSRNFFPVERLKKTINGLAMVKMNTFHWHISDSQNFPLLLKSHPDLALNSAYSADKMYTPKDVIEIVKYAKARGVRVIPEIDIPGHSNEGWYKKNLTSCFSYQPEHYCKGAHPCGQLDPSKDEVYKVLEDIYKELVEYIDPEIIHMGGDEVFMECWNASESLRSWLNNRGWNLEEEINFINLWGYFQENAMKALDRARGYEIPVIVWTSSLTKEPWLSDILDKDRYIIQIWTNGANADVRNLLEKGYNLIISNYDALYLDCGFGSWVGEGNNWCSPYIGWQKIYSNTMEAIGNEFVDQIYGAEAALWTEEVDEWSVEARIWPRASALAERLWTSKI